MKKYITYLSVFTLSAATSSGITAVLANSPEFAVRMFGVAGVFGMASIVLTLLTFTFKRAE